MRIAPRHLPRANHRAPLTWSRYDLDHAWTDTTAIEEGPRVTQHLTRPDRLHISLLVGVPTKGKLGELTLNDVRHVLDAWPDLARHAGSVDDLTFWARESPGFYSDHGWTAASDRGVGIIMPDGRRGFATWATIVTANAADDDGPTQLDLFGRVA